MEIPKFLKPREYKPLDLPKIKALDLTQGRKVEQKKWVETTSTIVYQRRG